MTITARNTLPFQPLAEDPANLKTGAPRPMRIGDVVSISTLTIRTTSRTATSKFYEFTVTGDLRIDDSFFTRYGTPTNGPYLPPA